MDTLLIGSVCVSLIDVAFSALEPIGTGSGCRSSETAASLPSDGPVSSARMECEAVEDGAWTALDENVCRVPIRNNTL